MAGHDIFQDMDRQDIQYAAGEADVQACFFPLQRLHPQLQVQELACQFLGVLVKIPSLRRRFHAFAAADKERRLHFPFQGSDDPAHALRRQAQVLGRLVDALFFKDPLKAADSMDVHGQDSLLSVIPLEQGLGPAVFHALGGQLVVEFFG